MRRGWVTRVSECLFPILMRLFSGIVELLEPVPAGAMAVLAGGISVIALAGAVLVDVVAADPVLEGGVPAGVASEDVLSDDPSEARTSSFLDSGARVFTSGLAVSESVIFEAIV